MLKKLTYERNAIKIILNSTSNATANNSGDIFKRIQALPLELRNEMETAVELLDHDKMCLLVSQIRDQDSILADKMQKEIDQYDYKKIQKVFQRE